MTVGANRQRQAWRDLPKAMRLAAAELLGSPVERAATQNGGFSPGSADRVVTADGRRAFVKTAIESENTDSAELHAHEAAVVAALPTGLPIPASLGFIARDGWVLAAYEDIDGRHPETPWRVKDLRAVFDAFAAISRAPAPRALRDILPPISKSLGAQIAEAGWDQVLPGTLEQLDHAEWVRPALAGPLGDVERFTADLDGDRVVHLDARADNILLREDGSAIVVDWPHACIGAAWVDPLALLIDATYFDPDLETSDLLTHPALASLSPETMARFFLILAGNFLAKSQSPAPRGIPGLREFQRAEGEVCIRLARSMDPFGRRFALQKE